MKFVTHYKIHDVFKPCFMLLLQKEKKEEKSNFSLIWFSDQSSTTIYIYKHRSIVRTASAILFKN